VITTNYGRLAKPKKTVKITKKIHFNVYFLIAKTSASKKLNFLIITNKSLCLLGRDKNLSEFSMSETTNTMHRNPEQNADVLPVFPQTIQVYHRWSQVFADEK